MVPDGTGYSEIETPDIPTGCVSLFRFEGRVASRSAGKAEEGGAPGLCGDRR
jgi:hypothetical protein